MARVLSVERDASNGNQPTHARDRIGNGPWRNASNVVIANNVAELHARSGDSAVFIDEHGQKINGNGRLAVLSSTTSSPDRMPTGHSRRD